jgi:uroporphyrinogen-III synthase
VKKLSHLKIMVTRPVHQAVNLISSIQSYGGTAISFPTLEILAIDEKTFLKQFKQIDNYNLTIFLSPNAVFKVAAYLHKIYPHWPIKTKIIAIGPGTANALKQEGLPVNYFPKKNFSSEDLLNLYALRNPKQKNILIIQGENGRGYLDEELTKKGAYVTTINAYKRQCPALAKQNIPNPNNINLIICTSNTGLTNLISLLLPYWHKLLFDKQLLVISKRIANHAKKLGFVKPPLISDNANNEAILQTLLTYAIERI